MLELVRTEGDRWAMQMGGDAYNVAVYLARGGVDTAFLTALGTDSFSEAMRAQWAAEGLDLSLVATVPDRVPGLYAIETDAAGERSFTYWRDRSAARALFQAAEAQTLCARAAQADLLYLSGITLSLFDYAGQQALRALAAAMRARGGRVAFDSNYRARGWLSSDAARVAIRNFAPHVDIALPTFADEAALFGDPSPDACATRWLEWGAELVIVKDGRDGALFATSEERRMVPTTPDNHPRDTTGAGDSFNGAFLAALLRGADPAMAVAEGHRLAGAVIRHPGAIIPTAVMPGRVPA